MERQVVKQDQPAAQNVNMAQGYALIALAHLDLKQEHANHAQATRGVMEVPSVKQERTIVQNVNT